MKFFFPAAVLFVILISFFSCASRSAGVFIPIPDENYYGNDNNIGIGISDITGTKDDSPTGYLPAWLSFYIIGGLEAVENLYRFNDKYVFVAVNESDNLAALNRWAENFSAAHDLAVLAAARVEKRMISSASLYPDDEYGLFFERMVKSAYNGEYPGAAKEETYWIKTKTNNSGELIGNDQSEIIMYFILLSIDKKTMQTVIDGLAAQTAASVTLTRNQSAAVNRLRQTFFNGF
ncbi:MAG: hypothetical protein LBG94_10215 [Treponema sp.]|jgi:hypothetical protein|nr:hypothetical protein [Treponema sp.]